MPIRSAAKALLYENGRILLNSHTTGEGEAYYDLPGGSAPMKRWRRRTSIP